MTKQKLSLRRLFSNTKFLVVFSIVLAFIFWIIVAIQYAPVDNRTITDVPVQLDIKDSVPGQLGLQVFGQKDFTVDITVEGSRLSIGNNILTADSFDVVAQTSYVNSAGKHNLQLKVTPKKQSDDYEITGLSTEYIEVYFDKYAEKEMEIVPKIVSEIDSFTDEGYLFDEKDIILPSKTVTLTGAQSEINRINKVYAEIPIKNKLTECVSVDAPVTFDVDSYSTSHVSIKGLESKAVPVTLPVYKLETLDTAVAFKNSPQKYVNSPLEYIINPSNVDVAILQNGSFNSDKLVVGTIDFNEIDTSGKSFTFEASKIENAKVLGDVTEFKVYLETDEMISNNFDLDRTHVEITSNDPTQNIMIDLSSIPAIKVIGTEESVSKLTASDIYAKIDLSQIKLSDSKDTKVLLNVYVKDSKDCWIYDTYYAYLRLK
ncbi:MAG: hypothetical protein KBT46_02000 [Ruminococcus sp.]|nr:hypothetical protein [Candidatus Copronaster equi]